VAVERRRSRATRRVDRISTVLLMRCRRPFVLVSAVPVAALALLAAGCGGGGSPGVASVGSSTTTTPSGTTTTQSGTLASAFAFARCMRAHGIPGWPDPTSGGAFDKSKLRLLGISVSRVRALEEGPCNIPLPSPGSQSSTITPADRADYLRAAACMRTHGFAGFPDPTFQSNSVQTNIPSSIDQDSAAFKGAAAICTKLIPAGLPYSGSGSS
jgi:hypothetical protein